MKQILVLLLFISINCLKTFAQDTLQAYDGGDEHLVTYGDFGITEIEVDGKKIKVESHFIKDAYLPDSTQIIKDGFGYRQYKMWGYTRRYYYQKGDANGPFFIYDSLGNIVESGNCIDGDLNGDYFGYYPNGKISIINHMEGSKLKYATSYYITGELKSKTYKDTLGWDQGDHYEYYKSGKLKVSGSHTCQIECVFIDLLDSNPSWFGITPNEEVKGRGIPNGKWKEYYENGNLKKEYEYCGCDWYYERGYFEDSSDYFTTMIEPIPCKIINEYDSNGILTLTKKSKAQIEEDTSMYLKTGWYYLTVSKNGIRRSLEGATYSIAQEPIINIDNIDSMEIYKSKFNNDYGLAFWFDKEGTEKWSIATKESISKRIAFVIDNELLHTPKVNSQITSGISALNRGDLSQEELQVIKENIEKKKNEGK